MQIIVYHNSETDLYDISFSGKGSENWDEISDLSEQEAIDEANAIADDTGAKIVFC